MSDPEGLADTVVSLQDLALKGLVKGFETASQEQACTFTCGGTVKLPRPARILFRSQPSGDSVLCGKPVVFPGSDDLSVLRAACKAATFGRGREEVTDPSYRKALALDTTSFVTDFTLSQHDILAPICNLSCPGAAAVTAKLYKMNIYQPGDFFKSHLDTPRDSSMVGSLVICLPYPHTGGELVIQHGQHSVRHDWGSLIMQNSNSVYWAFFYSDVQHEITNVESGNRITLTYNVFASPATSAPLQSVNLHVNAFGKALIHALDSDQFFPEGGQIGFPCEHLYPHTGAGFTDAFMKGVDSVIMNTARQLHLDTTVEPVWKASFGYCMQEELGSDEEHDCSCEKCAKASGTVPSAYGVGGQLQLNALQNELGGDLFCQAVDRLPQSYHARPAHSIQWIKTNFQFQLGLAGLGWGNEPCLEVMYSAAAIIISIPSAEARMQRKQAST